MTAAGFGRRPDGIDAKLGGNIAEGVNRSGQSHLARKRGQRST